VNLVYKEYIAFLKDNGVNVEKYNLKEGYYWLDRQIIKAYDKQGNIHKVLRMNIQDDLSIIVKDYKEEKVKWEIESWMETVERNKSKLMELEKESLELIRSSLGKYKEHKPIVLTSTGKDSQVVRYLVEQVLGNDVWKIFNNTSMDCAETYRMVKKTPNCTIVNPEEGFFQWQKRTNFIGNRTARACCLLYKEKMIDKVLDNDGKYLSFMGMRNDESNTRSEYQDEWINTNWNIKGMLGILCIRKWTEEDIWLYTLLKNIEINKKYTYGYHRVGCNVTCAFYAKSTWVLDKYWYPKMYERWHKIIDEDFTKNNKDLVMNCTKEEYHMCWNGTGLRKLPTKEVIGQFADRNKLDIKIAERYFNHYCEECDVSFNSGKTTKRKKIKDKNVLAMNMKFLGRNTTKFYCKKHLMELLNITKEQWNEYIEEFKSQGCDLF
jgi:3'-phosphoadenosine 5'-phosphosulfate sulfotransferase (PAPS reductase)/FAD synthetase